MKGIEIKKLSREDLNLFKELILLFEDVFEMKDFRAPGDRHLLKVLSTSGFFVFVASANGKVVGGLTAYTLEQYYSTRPLVYIYDLAVATQLQRKGIGSMLMSAITSHCREMGMEEVFVQADDVDLHALEFYRHTGGNAESVVHFTYPLERKK